MPLDTPLPGSDAQTDVSVSDVASASTETQPDELDTLLAEFERSQAGRAEPSHAASPATSHTAAPDDAALRAQVQVLTEYVTERELSALVTQMQETRPALAEVDKTLIERFLDGEARMDPRLAQAYARRKQDPGAWKRIMGSVAKKIENALPKPKDATITSHRAAMLDATRAAVVSNEGSTPTGPNFAAMSAAEFYKWRASR